MPATAGMSSSSSTSSDLVVHRVDEVHASAEGREPLPRERQGVRVAVEADEHQPGKALEERLGVSAETEGGVDEHGARASERGSEQLDGALEHDRGVQWILGHGVAGRAPRT